MNFNALKSSAKKFTDVIKKNIDDLNLEDIPRLLTLEKKLKEKEKQLNEKETRLNEFEIKVIQLLKSNNINVDEQIKLLGELNLKFNSEVEVVTVNNDLESNIDNSNESTQIIEQNEVDLKINLEKQEEYTNLNNSLNLANSKIAEQDKILLELKEQNHNLNSNLLVKLAEIIEQDKIVSNLKEQIDLNKLEIEKLKEDNKTLILKLNSQDKFIKNLDTQQKSIDTTKTNQLILLKSDKEYWYDSAFSDLIIEGDIDKLEWIKKNQGIINFKTIHSGITTTNNTINTWFEKNYNFLATQENFIKLLDFDMQFNRRGVCYSTLTTNVLDWFKSKNVLDKLDTLILKIFEYAIMCNNSIIIEWFEKNFDNFNQLVQNVGQHNFKTYWTNCVHKNYGYQNANNVHYKPWFDRYIRNNKSQCESLRAKGYWKNTAELETIIIKYMFDSSFDYNRFPMR